jgi:hypothetical protein
MVASMTVAVERHLEMAVTASAGWYPDPTDPAQHRWFDGTAWTAATQMPAPEPTVALVPDAEPVLVRASIAGGFTAVGRSSRWILTFTVAAATLWTVVALVAAAGSGMSLNTHSTIADIGDQLNLSSKGTLVLFIAVIAVWWLSACVYVGAVTSLVRDGQQTRRVDPRKALKVGMRVAVLAATVVSTLSVTVLALTVLLKVMFRFAVLATMSSAFAAVTLAALWTGMWAYVAVAAVSLSDEMDTP